MIYAAPFKMNKTDSAITNVFGKAKYFGLYNDETQETKAIVNENTGGPLILEELKVLGVETILTPHLGPRPLQIAHQLGMRVFYCGADRILLEEAVLSFKAGSFPEITTQNIEQYHSH